MKEDMVIEANNLPAVADGRDVVLAGDMDAGTLQTLVSHLPRSEVFDDVSLTVHVDRSADGATRSCFSYRACKHR
jgi:hypothetical protein